METVVVCNVKSYLPWLKGFLGGLLGKIPHAERHAAGHLMFDDVVGSAQPAPPAMAIDPIQRPGADHLHRRNHRGAQGRSPDARQFRLRSQGAGCLGAAGLRRRRSRQRAIRRGGYHCYLGVLPWYHSFGMTCAMLSACLSGSRLICVPDPRAGDPPFTDVLKLVQKHRPTLMPAVPTIFVAFANHSLLDQFDLTSMMGCFSGGAPLPPEVCRQFEEKTGAVIFEGYGLSETAPVASVNPTFSRQT